MYAGHVRGRIFGASFHSALRKMAPFPMFKLPLKKIALTILPLLLAASVAQAQFYYFGQNKVQYTKFHWEILKTKHFDIYYYPQMSELANQGARIAESGYRYLENLFDFSITHRIPLILYSSHLYFEQTNTMPGFIPPGVGGFFEFMKGRVVIPYDGSLYELKHVIRHELTHVFMFTKIATMLHEHRMSTDRVPPLWFNEGLAEFLSTKWDDQAEMVIRDAVLSGYLVPLEEMDRIDGTFLMYKEGQNILWYIKHHYGEDKIFLLIDNFWKSTSFSEDMKMTLGLDYREFDKKWIYHLQKKYYPLLATHDMPSRVTSDVCTEGFNDSPVYYKASDGKKYVYFIGNHDGYTDIYEQQLGVKSRPVVLIRGERESEFESFHLPSERIAISCNGLLAFVTKSGETDVLHLYDVNRKKISENKRFKDITRIGSVCFSSNGEEIAFSAASMEGYYDIYVYNLKSGKLRQLTHGYYDDRDPAWSPDGKWMVFSSDRTVYGDDGFYNLFLMNMQTGRIRYLTKGRESDFQPIWSPDGSELAYVSNKNGGQNIFIMPLDLSIMPDSVVSYQITNFITAAFNPDVTGSDTLGLIFSAFENYTFQIRTLDSLRQRVSDAKEKFTFAVTDYDSSWQQPGYVAKGAITGAPYIPKYSIDIAESQISTDPVFGTAGGAAMALSDMLGNDQYYFLLFNTAQAQDEILKSFNLAISKISMTHRMNYAYGVFSFAGPVYDLTDPDVYFYERSYGGYFSLSYPLSRFRRIEATTSLSSTYKNLYYGIGEQTSLLFSNSVAYVEDNSLWGPTGPMDGHRMLASIAYTSDVKYGSEDYLTLMLDYRRYFRINQTVTFATREALLMNLGLRSRRFFMGGSWSLRGWPLWSIRGKKLWIASEELRFPVINELNIDFPFGGVLFTAIRGAAYFDAGAAWDNAYTSTLGDFGVGLRFNLGGVLVLRWDMGKRIEDNFHKLEHGLFSQFFFGWDF